MKKFVAILLALTMVLAFAACAKTDTTETTAAAVETTAAAVETTAAAAEETTAATEGTEAAAVAVMTLEEYLAAAIDDQVCVETYVQDHQSWREGKITVYCQSPEGAVFAYDMACSEEDAAKLVPGTKIRITGDKAVWSGEVEIMNGTFEFVEGGDTYIAEALDVTDLLGTDELIDHQNEFVSFTGLTVAAELGALGQRDAKLLARPLRQKLWSRLAARPCVDAVFRPNARAYASLDDDVVVCRCENVTAGEIRAVVAEGVLDVNEIKLRLRPGMGPCQGRMCGPALAFVAAAAAGVPARKLGMLRIRPP